MPGRLSSIFFILCFSILDVCAQKERSYTLNSPDSRFEVTITAGKELTWAITHGGQQVISRSVLSLKLAGGEVLGNDPKIMSAKKETVNNSFDAVAYKKAKVPDRYHQLTLQCRGNYEVIFRAYNDAVAYRFATKKRDSIVIESEQVEFNFDKDYTAYIPHISDLRGGEKYTTSFEEFYTEAPVSKFDRDTMGYLPFLVKLDGNKKAVFLEADLQNYPGMFIRSNTGTSPAGIKGTFAPFPLAEALGGFNGINFMVTKRGDYIAKVAGSSQFPWRVIVVSDADQELLDNDIVQKLSAPSRIPDPSWIRPGKVAWDWWNDWNISRVSFRAGINTETYKYYIDFAAAYKLEYVVLDEGWSDDWDLMKLSPRIDLRELLSYARQKGVSLILWSTWYALSRDTEKLCKYYATMGVAGFKVDFLDRDDQKMVASCYEMAAIAAQHRLLLDFHGMFKPQGLQRTWPNVVNFEGVRGMEYMKWSADQRVPQHELRLPFIRMLAGPMDYTPGAIRNTVKGQAKPSNSSPVSMGTRCHQVAMYVMYEAPLQMLADNPTEYLKDKPCTDFIASIPTTFDETKALDARFGEYAVMARRRADTWYVGAMTNWDARDIVIDFSFLGEGNFELTTIRDGINADRDATDYLIEATSINSSAKRSFHLAPGGGLAIRIIRK